MSIRISVVLPNFNGEKYLRRAIESFISQIYDDKELLIVDGKSSDGSHAIIREYLERYDNIRWIKRLDDGISDAVNIGNSAGTGDIFGFIGSDDVLLPGALNAISTYADLVDFDGVFFNKYLYFVREKKFIKRPPPVTDITVEALLRYGTITDLQTIFYRRRVYEKYRQNPDNQTCMDYELLLELARDGAFLAYVDKEVVLEYMDGNISHGGNQKQLSEAHSVALRFQGAYQGPMWSDQMTGRVPATDGSQDTDYKKAYEECEVRFSKAVLEFEFERIEADAQIESLRSVIERLESENLRLARLHEMAQVLVRRCRKFPFSLYFRVKKKYRRIIRSIRNSSPYTERLIDDVYIKSHYDAATNYILSRYVDVGAGNEPKPLHMLVGSGELVRNALEHAPIRQYLSADHTFTFSIVTPFFKHKEYFGRCAKSVAALFRLEATRAASPAIEWIIVNDDPSYSAEELLMSVPSDLQPFVRILSDGHNTGVAAALNKGVRAARNNWIMLLDCDDMIEPNAVTILKGAITENPGFRYFSSAMIDIDDSDKELRLRKQDFSPTDLFEVGMVMGHMVTFSAEMFVEYGGFDEKFSGVQDYDFALRASIKERLGRIPQHLYRYRWHDSTISVSKWRQQSRLTDKVRAEFLRNSFNIRSSSAHCKVPLRSEPRALCIVRTQGKRMDLLNAAIASIRSQSIAMTACIVVHGGTEVAEFVKRNLHPEFFEGDVSATIVLPASEPGRRRGYPCNVGLKYLRDHASDYDLLCFLDDDDHLLPQFAERLAEAIRLNGADFAFGMTNALPVSGQPFIQHKLLPSAALFHGNFLPIHSYLIRTDLVLNAGIVFDEELDYLEDWDFLVQVMAAGGKGFPIFEVVSEYRLIGDGNAEEKRDAGHFEECLHKVRDRGRLAAGKISVREFWDSVLSFPTDRRDPLDPGEIAHLEAARDTFEPLEAK